MALPGTTTPVRLAGGIERRSIIRHALGFYGNLTVGGLYVFGGPTWTIERSAFISALRYCVTRHPILSTSIEGADTEAPAFVRPQYLDLGNHLHYLESLDVDSYDQHQEWLLKEVANRLSDIPSAYQDGIPAWRLVVLPLLAKSETSPTKFWLGFSYSHSHGDGKSSLAFHRTLLQGLQMAYSARADLPPNEIIQTSELPILLPSLEEVANLSISWSFLLLPLLSVYLPTWLSSWLGLPHGINVDSNAWKATPASYNIDNHCTGLEVICISQELLGNLLQACRLNNTKFTGILHEAIVYGLGQGLGRHTKFVACTATDLRRLVPEFDDNDMINSFSGVIEALEPHALEEGQDTIPEAVWQSARKTSKCLAERVNTLADQPIGLLKYLRNFRQYMLNQLGKEREGSYEVSNVGVFDPASPNSSLGPMDWTVQQIMFSQPANAIGSAVDFNVASVLGGDLIMTATWQRGILGVEDEGRFIRQTLVGIKEFLTRASKA